MIFLNERFPHRCVLQRTSVSRNTGVAVGGTAPTFASLASLASGSVAGIPMALAFFLAAGSLIYLIGALAIPETKGQSK
jgi:hypothetical protein